jgi:phosphoribosyl 1,2-cyclic phosphodiesterase
MDDATGRTKGILRAAVLPAPDREGAWLRVLASGSSGNCSVLVECVGGLRRVWLIDLGLSPKRTRLLLAASGLNLSEVEAAILTHLDSDHIHSGWAGPRARQMFTAPVMVHRRHEWLARRMGFAPTPFDGNFRLGTSECGARVEPILTAHDDLGAAALRFEFSSGGCLGFATDLGRTTPKFAAHMRAVDVLALESNYCPEMQLASSRPLMLKRRIMDGRGHLSNQQAAEAAGAIGPRHHLVLLHLSRECNTPERAAELHSGARYALTIASQHRPTGWVTAPARPAIEPRRPAPRIYVQASLFGPAPEMAAPTC